MSDRSHENVPRPDVKVNGVLLSAELLGVLLDLRVELPLNAPGQCTMRFFDEKFELMDSSTFTVGGTVAVTVPNALSDTQDVFTGEIVAIGAEQGPNRLTELVVTAYDRGHRLGRTSQGRTFLQQSYSDIVSTIAREAGLSAKVSFAGHVKFPYLLQTSDNATFLTETVRRTGAQWKVDGKNLRVFDPPLSTAPTATVDWSDGTLRSFKTRFSGSDWNSQVSVRGWDPANKAAIVGTNAAAPSFLASAPLASGGRTNAADLGTASLVARTQVVASSSEADEIARARRMQTASDEVLARGECFGNPAISPGQMVTVKGMGTRISGDYYVTEVEHVVSNRGFFTRFTAGSIAPTSIADLTSPSPSGMGVAIGLVSNLDDPDGMGRVRVKFPVLGDSLESEWARVVTPAGGGTRGFMMMPSVNDEVLVIFEHGDPRRPFVIGGVWNGLDKPPFANANWLKSGKVVQWGMKTESGHSLMFDDSEAASGKLAIVLSDGATKLNLGKDKVELFANSKNLEIKSGQASILLSENGDITIKGQKITIDAQLELKVHGQQGVNLTGLNIKQAADAKLELNSNAGTSIGSSAITEIKGSLVKIN